MQDLVLCGKSGSHRFIKIQGNHTGQLGKTAIFQQAAHHFRVYPSRIEIACGFGRKAKLRDVIILLVRHIGQTKEKIRGYIKNPGNTDDLLDSQFILCPIQKTADGAFRNANFRSKLCLRNFILLHQIL